jgi:hypothetical protein
MKTLFAIIGLVGALAIFCPPARSAGAQVSEAPFELVSGPTEVSLSTSAWTAIGTSGSGVYGIFIKNLDGNTGNTHVIATNSSSAPSVSTTTWQWSIAPTANSMYLGGAGKKVYFWGMTSHTSAETAVYTEVKPVR